MNATGREKKGWQDESILMIAAHILRSKNYLLIHCMYLQADNLYSFKSIIPLHI